jgi:hypothetical protein
MSKTASERAKQWIKDNPERHKANQDVMRNRKIDELNKSLRSLNRSKFKSPLKSIQAFCRLKCGKGSCSRNTLHSLLSCSHKSCPLFPFRNGDPKAILRGIEKGASQLVNYNKINTERRDLK